MIIAVTFLQGNIKEQKFCPVGKLLPGVSVVIMNDELEPQPMGVAGEVKDEKLCDTW